MIVLPTLCKDVGELFSPGLRRQKKNNRDYLLTILSNLRYFSRQGLSLKGDSNFTQLLKLHAEDDPRVSAWMEKKTDKYV